MILIILVTYSSITTSVFPYGLVSAETFKVLSRLFGLVMFIQVFALFYRSCFSASSEALKPSWI